MTTVQTRILDATGIAKLEAAAEIGELLPTAVANIKEWLLEPQYADFRHELFNLINQSAWTTLNDAFFTKLTFGTGGIRGTTGIGPNRINKVTIGQAAQGFAQYLKLKVPASCAKGVVIAYDVRLSSRELAEFTAMVLAGNDFKVYLFDNFRSTPELSFSVRYLNAVGGIVISASHNPPTDNGFKAYWSSGEQVVPPFDAEIINQVLNIKAINTVDLSNAFASKQISLIGKEIDEAYHQAVLKESLSPNRTAQIVYSPIHGTGITSLLPVLQQAGFEVMVVPEQQSPDGNFPNVAGNIPNPEVASANQAAASYLKVTGADVAFTNDPDADRLAVLVPQGDSFIQLTGNQTAVLAAYYVCSQLKLRGILPNNGFIARTVVTTPMIDKIAESFGLKVYNNLLVGFKYIGELIRTQQDDGDEQFVLGAEESLGLLKGTYVRDKDGAVAGLMMAELASELKSQNKTLLDLLNELYCRYGYYVERLDTKTFAGAEGALQKQLLMERLRDQPPKEIAGFVLKSSTHRVQAKDGSFIVMMALEDVGVEIKIFARPSGTEPKIKLYISLANQNLLASNDDLERVKENSDGIMEKLITSLKTIS